jgi:hypothetical protein
LEEVCGFPPTLLNSSPNDVLIQATNRHPELRDYTNNWAYKDFIAIFLTSANQAKSREAQKVQQDRYEVVTV